jgi:LysW-gamma-L-lysine carboxypeptidase
MPQTASDLLLGLVGIPSVSGDEVAAVSWLCEQLTALGYAARIDDAGNAVGTRGDGPIEILLLGHIDTVPGWMPVRVTNGVLHGRGAVDAKGPLVAFVAAGARAKLPPGVRLTVVGAVGEESVGSPGARWLVDHRSQPELVIIGEPSGWDAITLGYRGSIALTATVSRPLSHSAGPDSTAAELLVDFWNRVTNWLTRLNRDIASPFLRLEATLRTLSTISDGLRDESRAAITFRLPAGITSAWLRDQVEPLGCDAELSWDLNAEAYRTDKRSPLVPPFLAAIRAAGGIPRLTLKTGTSDMNVVGSVWSCPMVAYGPGDARFDHTPVEQIELADLERGVDVLTAALERIALVTAGGAGIVQD